MRPVTPARAATMNQMTHTVDDEAAQALSAAREYDDYALVINAMPMQAALRACEQVDLTCSVCVFVCVSVRVSLCVCACPSLRLSFARLLAAQSLYRASL